MCCRFSTTLLFKAYFTSEYFIQFVVAEIIHPFHGEPLNVKNNILVHFFCTLTILFQCPNLLETNKCIVRNLSRRVLYDKSLLIANSYAFSLLGENSFVRICMSKKWMRKDFFPYLNSSLSEGGLVLSMRSGISMTQTAPS